MTDELTCDRNGCDLPAFARYRHVRTHEWINVCGPCRPMNPGSGDIQVENSNIFYHTLNHPSWPAETPSEVQKANSFKRMQQRKHD